MSSHKPTTAAVMARASVLLDNWDFDGAILRCGAVPIIQTIEGVTPRTLEIMAKLMNRCALTLITRFPALRGDWDANCLGGYLSYHRNWIAKITDPSNLSDQAQLVHAQALIHLVDILNTAYRNYPASNPPTPTDVYGPGIAEAFRNQGHDISIHRRDMMAAHDSQLLNAGIAAHKYGVPALDPNAVSVPPNPGSGGVNHLITSNSDVTRCINELLHERYGGEPILVEGSNNTPAVSPAIVYLDEEWDEQADTLNTGFKALNDLVQSGASRDTLVIAGGMSKEPKTLIKATPRAIDVGITTVNRSPLVFTLDEDSMGSASVFNIEMLASESGVLNYHLINEVPAVFQQPGNPLRQAILTAVLRCLTGVVPIKLTHSITGGYGISFIANAEGVGELFKYYAVLRDHLAKGIYMQWVNPENGGFMHQSGKLYDTGLTLSFTPMVTYGHGSEMRGYQIDLTLNVPSEPHLALVLGLGFNELREYVELAELAANVGVISVQPVDLTGWADIDATPIDNSDVRVSSDNDDFNPGHCDIGTGTIQIGDDD